MVMPMWMLAMLTPLLALRISTWTSMLLLMWMPPIETQIRTVMTCKPAAPCHLATSRRLTVAVTAMRHVITMAALKQRPRRRSHCCANAWRQ